MKKFLKVLAAAAALAAVVPYKAKADENGGEVEGLLWKATWKLDPDYQSDPDINVTIGLNNPFEKLNKESHLFADDLVVDYCCDETLTHAPVTNESRLYTEEDVKEEETVVVENNCSCTESSDCGCESDCGCGDDCGCKE